MKDSSSKNVSISERGGRGLGESPGEATVTVGHPASPGTQNGGW